MQASLRHDSPMPSTNRHATSSPKPDTSAKPQPPARVSHAPTPYVCGITWSRLRPASADTVTKV